MTELTIWEPTTSVFRDYRAEAAVGVGLVGLVIFVFLALVALYNLVRVAVAAFRFFSWSFIICLVTAFDVASQPVWLVFSFMWPQWFGGDHWPLPPVSCEFTGERLERGLLEPNQPFEVGERRLPVSAHLECARLRSRAVWVRRLEHVLGGSSGVVGALVKGRWTPDLPLASRTNFANLVLTHAEGGAKILGGGSLSTGEGDKKRMETYILVELSDGSRETVFPELLARLASYSLLRERDATLLSALRLRAQEWCKGAGLSSTVSLWAVVSALKLAWPVGPLELSLLDTVQAVSPSTVDLSCLA